MVFFFEEVKSFFISRLMHEDINLSVVTRHPRNLFLAEDNTYRVIHFRIYQYY